MDTRLREVLPLRIGKGIAMNNPQVCIVGAGSSGLTAAKSLKDRGIAFDCFEKGSGVGGLWRFQNDNGMSAAYRSLHINTSRDKMGFSDYRMPRSFPDFPHHSLVLDYFEDFTDRFGFRDQIKFRTSVVAVEPQADGKHRVTTVDEQGRRESRDYNAVLIANGHHWSPRYAKFPGEFTNETMHSHHYESADSMAGKKVLVVGIGNSGCDIACEASRVADRVFLSTRRGAHIIPKYMFGKPLDKMASRWMWEYIPFWFFQRMFGLGLQLSRGSLEKYGLPKPQHRILEEHPTISADLLNYLGHGKLGIKPNVTELAGGQVQFEDGSKEEIDLIVYATGYDVSIPFLDNQILNTANNEVRLYKRVVHPEYPGLYFVGLIQPWGAIMPLAEAQGKWIGDLLLGKCGLPDVATMNQHIIDEREKVARRYTQTVRHTIQVDFYPYLRDMKRQRTKSGNLVKLPENNAVVEKRHAA